jgi:hypothetical protein
MDYTDTINWAKDELANIKNDYNRKKSDIINHLADKLAKITTIETHKISKIIHSELKDYGCSARYIREVLPPEYKQQSKSRAKSAALIYAAAFSFKNETKTRHSSHYVRTEQDKEIIRLDKENNLLKHDILAVHNRILAVQAENKALEAEIAQKSQGDKNEFL